MLGKKKILLACLTLAASYLPATSVLAIPTTGEQVESGNFNISSVWLGATREAYGPSQSDTQTDTALVTLAAFDSSLGELTGVTLFFNSWWNLGTQVNAVDTINNRGTDTSQGTATSRLDLLIDLVTPDGAALSGYLTHSESCTRRSGSASNTECSDSAYFENNYDRDLGLGGLSVSDFADTMLTFQLSRTISITASSSDGDSRVVASSDFNKWEGAVTARYAYVERAEVPEPASLALIGAGLVAMRFRRRTPVARRV